MRPISFFSLSVSLSAVPTAQVEGSLSIRRCPKGGRSRES